MTVRSVLRGVGAALPAQVLTNDDLARRIDTTDAWIRERTGIERRHIASAGEVTSDLAAAAARAALERAGMTPGDVDVVIVATTTPDDTFPACATVVQAKLGMAGGFAFDVQAVCSGFVYALTVADSLIVRGLARTALVIGAETMSRLLDWEDRTTCVLFGDGAGAVVLSAAEGAGTIADRGVLSSRLYSDGRLRGLLYVDGGPSSTGTVGHLRMQGREVFKHAVTNIADSMVAAAEAAGVSIADIDWFVPHQANQRILDGVAKKLGIPAARVVSTVAEHGNTSAASVPLALASAVADGRIREGQLVLLEAMGGGLTWGSVLLRF